MSKVTIFYSWQTSIPVDDNKRPIELAIKEACLKVAKDCTDFDYVQDEATRNMPGSPNIPETIFAKINTADIFIADITTINKSDIKNEKTANPNVLIELGYARSCIGQERIILLFNKQHGDFPDDVAFDIAQSKIIGFKIIDKNDKNGIGQLTKDLTDAIKLIFNKNPPKPNINASLTPEAIKRLKDVKTIREFCKSIEIFSIEKFISEFHIKFSDDILFYFEGFKAKVESLYFHLYDTEIKTLFDNFLQLWTASLSFYHKYEYNGKGIHIFCMHYSRRPDDDTLMETMSKIQDELSVSFAQLLKTIHEKWIEVNLEECSNFARNTYIEFTREHNFSADLSTKD